jgi:hypothetical protein
MCIPALIAAAAYLASYGQYRRVILEAPPGRGAGRWAGIGSWLLEHWIANPREQGAFAFLWKSLARSNAHRLVLLTYTGLALGWIVEGALDMPAPSLRDEGVYGMLVTVSPLETFRKLDTRCRSLYAGLSAQQRQILRCCKQDGLFACRPFILSARRKPVTAGLNGLRWTNVFLADLRFAIR